MLTFAKPHAEKALKPLGRLLKNVNPNVITLFGLVFPVVFFVLILHKQYVWGLVAIVLCAGDMLDGMVARMQNKVTAFGGFLDSTIDRFADFVMLVAFGYAGLVGWNIVLPLVMCTYLISYIRSRTELAAKYQLVAAVGILERTERFIGLFAGLLLFAVFPKMHVLGQNLMAVTFAALLVLSVVTVAQRVVFAYKHLD
ncbi:MAG TPA: CDP-alcohol phosphatidyltransferase family protein [Candidatus Saccharimonadales bacterium]|nr:CDP-alcohol phosphatidyltransferase family protein [Candidatus Saccharimonadales bacterium]